MADGSHAEDLCYPNFSSDAILVMMRVDGCVKKRLDEPVD